MQEHATIECVCYPQGTDAVAREQGTVKEYEDQDIFPGVHGWYWTWRRKNGRRGGFAITRIASLAGRGGVLRIMGYGVDANKGPRVDVYVSDAGQSLRVYLNGEEMSTT